MVREKAPLIVLLAICLTVCSHGFAQSQDILLNHDLYHYLDRVDIRGYTDSVVHTDIKPVSRAYVADVLRRADRSQMGVNERKWHQRMYKLVWDDLPDSTNRTGILGEFYRNGRDFYQLKGENFQLFANPALSIGGGFERHQFDSSGTTNQGLSLNSRGFVLRGMLYKKIGIYAEVHDNLARYPQFVIQRSDIQPNQRANLPGETFVKTFDRNPNALNFFHNRAYMTYQPAKFLNIKFGHDRAFWGNGYQSLALSDNGANYFFLQFNSCFWKLEYTNLFAQMIDYFAAKPDRAGTFPRKYAVFHQLSYKPTSWLSLGAFESIVYSPVAPNGQRGFELQYLNPLIFFRSIEQTLGSSDNGTLGFTTKINALKHLQVYTQFVIDDFNFAKFRDGDGFWANRFGYQAGLKYIDLLNIPTLDVQLEYNRLRPFMYQHFNVASNYRHYGQNLGHAAGSNLNELNLIFRYHPLPAWNVMLRYSRMQQGLNPNGENYGGDIGISTDVPRPVGDFGNEVAQGDLLEIDQLYGRLTYQLGHSGTWLDVIGRYRTENEVQSAMVLAGIRLNLAQREIKY
ncbi:MAG: capsule assembly Wzi family protein [Bacteroidota bacterium]